MKWVYNFWWKYSFKFCTSLYLWKWIIANICATFKSRHKSFLASLSSKRFTQWGNTFRVWPRFLLNRELWIDAMSFQVYQSTQLKSEVRHFDYKAIEWDPKSQYLAFDNFAVKSSCRKILEIRKSISSRLSPKYILCHRWQIFFCHRHSHIMYYCFSDPDWPFLKCRNTLARQS